MTGLGLGLGLGPYTRTQGGGATDPDAIAYLAAVEAAGVSFTLAKEMAFDAFFLALKAETGLYDTFDGYYVRWVTGSAALSEAAGKINLISPGTFNLTKSGTVTYDDDGWAGNGVDGVLDTGFNPTTAGGAWSLDSAHLGLFAETGDAGGTDVTAGNAGMNIRGVGDNVWYAAMNSVSVSYSAGVYTGHFVNLRRESSRLEYIHNGGRLPFAPTSASTSVTNATVRFLRGTSSFSARKYAVHHFGGGQTNVQAAANYAALITLLQDTL